MAALDALTAQTLAGTGGIVLLAGEPGIGKTRLAREATRRAEAVGAVSAWAACRESAHAPPLWPWVQVLRRAGGSVPRPSEPSGPADGAAARYRLFMEIEQRLRAWATASPVLVVIDDLHRADEASLLLLSYLADVLWPAPIGLVGTYRDTELPATATAARVVAQLARAPGASRHALGGLDRNAVRTWLQRAGIHGVDATQLHDRTDGNPLFLAESIQLIMAGTPAVGGLHSVGDVIRERLAPLSVIAREALEVAAVLGRDFDYAPLSTALRTSPAAAVAALDESVAARLVDADPTRAGTYRFVHALVRDAVEDQLTPSRGADLHARSFGALRDTGWGQPADVAHHALRARSVLGDRVAAQACRDAAEAADRLLGWEEAADWWRAAIGLRPESAAAEPRMRLGRSLLLAGRVDEARTEFAAVAAAAGVRGDPATLAEAALAVGDTVSEVAADAALLAVLDRALAEPTVTAAVRAQLTARRAIATYWQPGGHDDSRTRSAAAVELAELAGDPRTLGAALIARQFTLRGPDRLEERIAVGAQVVDLAEHLGDDDLRFRAYQWLIPDRYQVGDIAAVAAGVAQMAAIAEARHNPLQSWWVLLCRCLLAAFAGQYAEAERLSIEAATVGQRLGQPAAEAYRLGQLSLLYWRSGRLAELEPDVRAGMARFPGLVTLRAVLALTFATSGRRVEALHEIRALSADRFRVFPRDSLYLASVAILAEAAVTCAEPQLAGPLLTELAPYAHRNLIQGVPIGWGAGAWYLARLARTLGHTEQAHAYAQTARDLHRRWGAHGLGDPLDSPAQTRPGGLSLRETQVLRLVAAGRLNAEIADDLHVSVHTVERHVANIFRKTDVRNRAEATAWAHRHGLAD